MNILILGAGGREHSLANAYSKSEKVKKVFIDCDGDTILIKAELIGSNVCHTGNKTCFKEAI